MKLSEPVSSNPKFKAEIAPLEEGKKYELTVTLVPPLVSGNNTGKIELTTGIPDVPKIDVAVYAFVTAAVDVTPDRLSLPADRSAETSRQFYIRSNSNKPVKITELACTNPLILLELTDVKDQLTYRLKVDVPANYEGTPTGADRITFKTDEPTVPMITIPITVMPSQVRPGMVGQRFPAGVTKNQPVARPAQATAVQGAAGTGANVKPTAQQANEKPAVETKKAD